MSPYLYCCTPSTVLCRNRCLCIQRPSFHCYISVHLYIQTIYKSSCKIQTAHTVNVHVNRASATSNHHISLVFSFFVFMTCTLCTWAIKGRKKSRSITCIQTLHWTNKRYAFDCVKLACKIPQNYEEL